MKGCGRGARNNATTQEMIDRKIEELRADAPPQEPGEALRHNMELVREHQQEIRRVESWPEAPALSGTGAAAPAGSGS